MVQRKRNDTKKKGELLQMARQQVKVHKQQFNKPPIKTIENLHTENSQHQIKKYLIHEKLDEILRSIAPTCTANNEVSVITIDESEDEVSDNKDTLWNVLPQTSKHTLKQQEDRFHHGSPIASVSSSCSLDSEPDRFEMMRIKNLQCDQPKPVGKLMEGNTCLYELQSCDTSDLSSFDGMDPESDRLEEMKINNLRHDPPPEQIENLKEVMRCTNLWFSKHRLCVEKSNRLSWAQEFEEVSLTRWKNIVLTGTVVFELKRNQVVKFHSRTELPTFSKNSIMFWGFISANFRGIFPLEDNKLNVTKLRKMLMENVFPLVSNDSDWCFIHYPEYQSSFFDSVVLKNILHQRSFERYMWPSFMEDLNPMEHLWEMMESKLCEHICGDLLDVVSVIQNLWNYDLEFRTLLNNFVEVMPLVMQRVVETKGGTI